MISIGLVLPVLGQILEIQPNPVNFGDGEIGEILTQEVTIRYSTNDVGRVTLMAYNSPPFKWNQTGAEAVHRALDLIYLAMLRYWEVTDDSMRYSTPAVYELNDLGLLHLADDVRRDWRFQISRFDPAVDIHAISRSGFKYGEGLNAYLEFGQWGWGEPKHWAWGAEFVGIAMEFSQLCTLQVDFTPDRVGISERSIEIQISAQDDNYAELDSIHCIGSSGLSVNSNTKSSPQTFRVFTAFPNPFNSTTNIAIALPSPSDGRLSIIGLDGREVAILKEGYSAGGDFNYVWNAKDNPAGAYFVRFGSSNQQTMRQILLIR